MHYITCEVAWHLCNDLHSIQEPTCACDCHTEDAKQFHSSFYLFERIIMVTSMFNISDAHLDNLLYGNGTLNIDNNRRKRFKLLINIFQQQKDLFEF